MPFESYLHSCYKGKKTALFQGSVTHVYIGATILSLPQNNKGLKQSTQEMMNIHNQYKAKSNYCIACFGQMSSWGWFSFVLFWANEQQEMALSPFPLRFLSGWGSLKQLYIQGKRGEPISGFQHVKQIVWPPH